MLVKTCPHCGQPLRNQRGGVFMSSLKAALFDAVVAAGDIGITAAELTRLPVWRDRRRVQTRTIRSHVYQINDALAATRWRIAVIDRRYVLVRQLDEHDKPIVARGRLVA